MEFLKSIKIKLIHKDAKIPLKATANSSGYDLFACEEHLLKRKTHALIATGIIIELKKGMEAQVRPRSGLAVKHCITVLNSPGTIDADYRGEIKVALINHSDEDFSIKNGMRVAQLIFSSVVNADFRLVDTLNKTKRNDGGFGSTGKE